MFHPQIIQRKQDALELALAYPLYRYDVDHCRFFVEHLDSITIKDKGGKAIGFSRALKSDEQEFITNERYLCSIDFLYWAERYHWLQHIISKKLILFSMAFSQLIYLRILGEMELAGVPLSLQFLKGRQLRISSTTEAIHLYRFLFKGDLYSIIASSDEDKSWAFINNMMLPSLERQPFWLIPHDVQTWATGEEFAKSKEMNAGIYVQHGRQKIGIGRGGTPSSWHFSELFEWLDAEAQLKAAFEHGVHYSRDTFGVKEATARGRNNFWHELWKFNEQNYPLRLSLERPVFLPYFLGVDIYPDPGFRSTILIPDKWFKNPEDALTYMRRFPYPEISTPWELINKHAIPEHAIRHKEKCDKYSHTSEILRDALGEDWEMPPDQLWWYVYNYEKAKKSKEGLGPFLSEVPSSPDEAFQSQQSSVFPVELLQTLRTNCADPVCPPLKISGSQIPSHIEPQKDELVDFPLPYSEIVHYYRNLEFKWSLHPTLFSNYEEELYPLDKLWIWEWPVKNYRYAISLDDADGIDKDASVLEVLRLGTPSSPCVQVAEFASKTLSALDIWPIYLLLLRLYSQLNVMGDDIQALACPEINRGGKAVINELLKLGWSNFYIRKDLSRVRQTANVVQQLGWNTGMNSRTILTSWFMKFVKGGHFKPNSPWLIEEMRDFIANELIRTVRLEAGKGAHDDRIFAKAITIVCGHDLDIQGAETPYWIGVVEHQQRETELPDPDSFLRLMYSTSNDGEIEKQKLLEEVERLGYDQHLIY